MDSFPCENNIDQLCERLKHYSMNIGDFASWLSYSLSNATEYYFHR